VKSLDIRLRETKQFTAIAQDSFALNAALVSGELGAFLSTVARETRLTTKSW
jgi:hypothetical protein